MPFSQVLYQSYLMLCFWGTMSGEESEVLLKLKSSFRNRVPWEQGNGLSSFQKNKDKKKPWKTQLLEKKNQTGQLLSNIAIEKEAGLYCAN